MKKNNIFLKPARVTAKTKLVWTGKEINLFTWREDKKFLDADEVKKELISIRNQLEKDSTSYNILTHIIRDLGI